MNPTKAIALLSAALCALLVAGCGDDKTVDTSYQKQGLEAAGTQRRLFDSVKGDWDKLSDADKATFTKTASGDAIVAQASWIGMKSGASAAQDYLRQNGRIH